MVNMPKCDLHFLCYKSSNLGTMPPKRLPISTEDGERDPHVIRQYEGGSENFVVEMKPLNMNKVEEEYAVLIMNNFKQLLNEIFVKM